MKRQRRSTAVTKRSQARMLALQALCAFEAVGEEFGEQLDGFLQDPEALADLEIAVPPPPETVRFARTLARGAWGQRRMLNEMLSRTAAHWSLSRMTPVDRNILRLGLHELLEHAETAPQIVINEAIELARRFGDKDSPAFVNGVLDAVRRTFDGTPDPAIGGPEEPKATPEVDHGNGAV